MNKSAYLFCFFLAVFSLCAHPIYADIHEAAVNNEKGVKALNEGHYHAAIESFQNALKESPDNDIIKKNLSNAYHNYAMVLLKRGETFNAIDSLERSLTYVPENVYSIIDLGRVYYNQNNLKKAIFYFEMAYGIKPDISGLKALLEKAQKEVLVEDKLNRLQTTHFIIVSEEDLHIDNLANVRIILDQAYSRIGGFFGYYPKQKTTVVLYPENSYRQLMKGRPYWSHAVFDGKIRLPLADTVYSQDYLRKIIYHEYAHALIRELTKGNCPIWLNEGLACYCESFVEAKDRAFFKNFITKKTLIPFSKLPNDYDQIENKDKAQLVYREFYLVALFFIEKYGMNDIRAMFDMIDNRKTTQEVVSEITKMDSRSFDKAWARYVKEKLGLT